jgi:hypothetical protein
MPPSWLAFSKTKGRMPSSRTAFADARPAGPPPMIAMFLDMSEIP